MKNYQIILVFIIFLILLSGCVPGDGKHDVNKPTGFFWGIWHGWIAPITLIIQIFNHSVRIYEKANTGWWYDFGFYIAIISGFGGLSLTRRKKRKK